MLFAGLGSVRMVKNCDLGHQNAALSLQPQAAFSTPWSQFFTIWTSQPANNLYVMIKIHSHTRFKTTALKSTVKSKFAWLSKSKSSARMHHN